MACFSRTKCVDDYLTSIHKQDTYIEYIDILPFVCRPF